MEYRTFRNTDPPKIVDLWNRTAQGRGAATGITPEAFEFINHSNPYFDPAGVILAVDGERLAGFVHAGFGPDDERAGLSKKLGVICAVLVDDEYRGNKVGTELINRAEQYLRDAGAETIIAGAAPPNDPFYVGLYGGVQPAGWLDSDPSAVPFFQKLGYEPHERHVVYQRDISDGSDPVNVQLINIRRNSQLSIYQGPLRKRWWWFARFGELDTVRFVLTSKDGQEAYAALTVVGLDFYLPKWQCRSIGFIDFDVAAKFKQDGYGQALLVEVCRRLRQEMITIIEMHAREDDAHTIAILEAAGFSQVDAGTVLRKTS